MQKEIGLLVSAMGAGSHTDVISLIGACTTTDVFTDGRTGTCIDAFSSLVAFEDTSEFSLTGSSLIPNVLTASLVNRLGLRSRVESIGG